MGYMYVYSTITDNAINLSIKPSHKFIGLFAFIISIVVVVTTRNISVISVARIGIFFNVINKTKLSLLSKDQYELL